MKVSAIYAVSLVTLFLLFSCKKSTKPVIPGWEVLSIGVTGGLVAVDFVDENYGWVIAGGATVIFHTTDGGNNWTKQPISQIDPSGAYPQLLDIQFVDRNNGWAVGFPGTILKTTDGGNTWVVAVKWGVENFYCVLFTDPRHGWVCGGSYFGGISYLRTTDSGQTWNPVYSNPYQIHLKDFVDSLNGWALINDAINKTSDGGISWTNIYPGPISNVSFDFVDLYNGWGLAAARVSEYDYWYWMIHTVDGGYTWEGQSDTFKYNLLENIGVIGPMKMFNARTGWLAKWESNKTSVLRTTNGGYTWLEQLLPNIADRHINDFDFIDENIGWAVGSSGLVLRTKTGGSPIR